MRKSKNRDRKAKQEENAIIHPEKITYDNAPAVRDRSIFESQHPFAAGIRKSLAVAYPAVTSEAFCAYPFAIFDDDTLAGFLMPGKYEAALEGPDAPASKERNSCSLLRLMTDKRCQKQDFGRGAARPAPEFVRTWPHGKAEACVTFYNPENKVAKKLYAYFGFAENGEMDDEEIVAVLKLQSRPTGRQF